MSLLNGLAHVAPTRAALGAARTVFGACLAAVGREGPAGVRHHGGDAIWLGLNAENGAAAREARRHLSAAGLDVPAPQREDRVLWTKAVFNAATNPVGALTGRTNGELAGVPALWEVVSAALREGARAAEAAGHPLLFGDFETVVRRACLAAGRQENSMLQDLRAGRPTETGAILGPLLAEARRRRTPAPVLESLARFTRGLERELAR